MDREFKVVCTLRLHKQCCSLLEAETGEQLCRRGVEIGVTLPCVVGATAQIGNCNSDPCCAASCSNVPGVVSRV